MDSGVCPCADRPAVVPAESTTVQSIPAVQFRDHQVPVFGPAGDLIVDRQKKLTHLTPLPNFRLFLVGVAVDCRVLECQQQYTAFT